MIKLLKRLFILLLFAVMLGAVFFVCLQRKYKAQYLLPRAVEVMIPSGSGLNRVADILAQNKVIDDARLFVLFARATQNNTLLKAGEYSFSDNVSYQSVIEKLVKGNVIVRSLTIPEGKSLAEIKRIVQDNPYLSGDITLSLKEGEILPETYHFVRGEKRDAILEKARSAMKKTLKDAFSNRDTNLFLANEQELLILASIVEKETGLESERRRVAAVFINRLRLGMKLQTDPTVIYAVTQGKMNLARPIYKKDLAYDSPYNTYLYQGLPPGPICSPGKAAIEAVAHPEQVPYLYFVADGVTGGHRFAKTLSEHNHNVVQYRNLSRH